VRLFCPLFKSGACAALAQNGISFCYLFLCAYFGKEKAAKEICYF
jgi:hypothetical protein